MYGTKFLFLLLGNCFLNFFVCEAEHRTAKQMKHLEQTLPAALPRQTLHVLVESPHCCGLLFKCALWDSGPGVDSGLIHLSIYNKAPVIEGETRDGQISLLTICSQEKHGYNKDHTQLQSRVFVYSICSVPMVSCSLQRDLCFGPIFIYVFIFSQADW